MRPGTRVVSVLKQREDDNWRGIVLERMTRERIDGLTNVILRVSWIDQTGGPSKELDHYPQELREEQQ